MDISIRYTDAAASFRKHNDLILGLETRRLYVLLGILATCGTIMIVADLKTGHTFGLHSGGILLFYCVLTLISRVIRRSSVDSRIFRYAQILASGTNEAQLRINEQGIGYRSGIVTWEVIWEFCEGYLLRGDYLIINANKRSYGPFVIERQAVSPEEFDSITELVKRKLPGKR